MPLKYQPYGRPVEVSPGIARVTFSTRKRTITPQYIRARVELAGHFDIVARRMTQPRIIAQGTSGDWMTWESRLLDDSEPDSALA